MTKRFVCPNSLAWHHYEKLFNFFNNIPQAPEDKIFQKDDILNIPPNLTYWGGGCHAQGGRK